MIAIYQRITVYRGIKASNEWKGRSGVVHIYFPEAILKCQGTGRLHVGCSLRVAKLKLA